MRIIDERKIIEMTKKFYDCFSYNQMLYLEGTGIKPKRISKHHSTNNTIWIFEVTEELSKLLFEWTKRGKNKIGDSKGARQS